MRHSILLTAVLAALALSGCDRPSVVEVPGPTVAVPGPAGPPGATVVQVEHRDRDDRRDDRGGHEERSIVVNPAAAEHTDEHRTEAVRVEHGNTSVTVVNPRDTK